MSEEEKIVENEIVDAIRGRLDRYLVLSEMGAHFLIDKAFVTTSGIVLLEVGWTRFEKGQAEHIHLIEGEIVRNGVQNWQCDASLIWLFDETEDCSSVITARDVWEQRRIRHEATRNKALAFVEHHIEEPILV